MSSTGIELTFVDIINRAIRSKRAVSIIIEDVRDDWGSGDASVIVKSGGLDVVIRLPGPSSARGYARAIADVCAAMGAECVERDDAE